MFGKHATSMWYRRSRMRAPFPRLFHEIPYEGGEFWFDSHFGEHKKLPRIDQFVPRDLKTANFDDFTIDRTARNGDPFAVGRHAHIYDLLVVKISYLPPLVVL